MHRLLSGRKVGRELVIVEEQWEQGLLQCKNIEEQAAELGNGEEISEYPKREAKPDEDQIFLACTI